jgi:hypothetical protein
MIRKPKKVCRPPRVPKLDYCYHARLPDLLMAVRSNYFKKGWKLVSVFGNVNAGYTAVVQQGRA